jgi:dTDP-4-amino-4,6-dideoxygalactose transaminase
MIPFVDLAAQHRLLAPELESKLRDLLGSSQFILGDELAAFESEFASYVGAAHGVGVANGTEALQLVCEALLDPGDEVVVPAYTFTASALAVSHARCRPRFVDVDSETFTIDPDQFESAIGPQTRAVMAVHLYGHPAPMGEIGSIARRRGLRVIEDCAQAHGATYDGARVGSLGDAGCFSFYPSKNLGALGDAGLVVTEDPKVRDRLRALRHLGQEERNVHQFVGYTARLDALQAAFLRVKLPHLDRFNELRHEVAAAYAEELADTGLKLPIEVPGCTHVYHLFVIRHPRRDAIRRALQEAEIGCAVHYETPVPQQPCYSHLGLRPGTFPVAEQLGRDCLALPMFPELSRAQIAEVGRVIRSVL